MPIIRRARRNARRVRSRALLSALVLVSLGLPIAALAAAGGEQAHDSAIRRAPALSSPRDDATVESVPSFAWSGVKGAAKYEFQLSADGAFRSIVNGQGNGSFQTLNKYATVSKTVPDGKYFWRVRGVDKKDHAGPWSQTRTLVKSWSTRPVLLGPGEDTTVNYPNDRLILRWSAVPRAYKYLVEIATDQALGSSALPPFTPPIETSGTSFALGMALQPGRYYWAVTPLDAQKHRGTRSTVGSFVWSWPSGTTTRVNDLNASDRVFDPQFAWDPIPGASRYEVEVNPTAEFEVGSKVCCSDATIGTSLSPKKVLPNNTYHWRVRGIDVDGNAGTWNYGGTFRKDFDNPPPPEKTIPGLHMRDNVSDPATDLNPASQCWTGLLPFCANVVDTHYPVVVWSPVRGASSYQIQVVPWEDLGAGYQCNWTAPLSKPDRWDVKTASTAWTPLSPNWNGALPGGVSFPSASTDVTKSLKDGVSYCLRVLARSDRDSQNHEVVSDWTSLGDTFTGPAFTYHAPPPTSPSGPLVMPDGNYREPQTGTLTPRLPLFTWDPVDGAGSYFVVVAKDQLFTEIVDVALTRMPAYAPRLGIFNSLVRTYPDETTTYYWAVMPAAGGDGNGVATVYPWQNNPHQFEKRSHPPAPLGPTGGAHVTSQPTFRWTDVEGAREYRLQVAQDPSFGELLDDVTTASTSYTSSTTYPADSLLYWRVRANDENRIGLTWSSVETFRRILPAPRPADDNPTGGRTIPVLTWTPVEGAVSYDLQVDQPDGTKKTFNMRSTAFTPVAHYGTGVWTWKVRANFPKLPFGTTAGAFSNSTPFTRFIGAPAATRATRGNKALLLSWDPTEMAKQYKVEISEKSSFSTLLDQQLTDNTSFAPKMTQLGFQNGGTLYWRVAATDEGNNVGGWTSGTFGLADRMIVRVRGKLRKRRQAVVTVKVTNSKGRPIRQAKVQPKGAGINGPAKRTSKRGIAKFKLRPRRGGKLIFRAVRGGYRNARATVRVR
jgi:hypothetical protein